MALMGVTLFAQEPEFTKDNKLKRPADYREWIFLSSGLGLTYGETTGRRPATVRQCVRESTGLQGVSSQTGVWPEKTMFVLEVRSSASNRGLSIGRGISKRTSRIFPPR